jgi:hypothetical protein
MKRAYHGLGLLALHCALVLTVAAKYAWDRDRLPRAWANATPVDPSLPIRGRYVTMQLRVVPDSSAAESSTVRLNAENGRLIAHPDPKGTQIVWRRQPDLWVLTEPVAFFIPEHASDPSVRAPGEELWVEVSVPRNGPPRPIRLGVKKDGVLTPLPLN